MMRIDVRLLRIQSYAFRKVGHSGSCTRDNGHGNLSRADEGKSNDVNDSY